MLDLHVWAEVETAAHHFSSWKDCIASRRFALKKRAQLDSSLDHSPICPFELRPKIVMFPDKKASDPNAPGTSDRLLPEHSSNGSASMNTVEDGDDGTRFAPKRCHQRVVGRSASLSDLDTATHECEVRHIRIAYWDDTVRELSVEKVVRLLRAGTAAQTPCSVGDSNRDNSVWFAKKALRYRGLLRRSQTVNLDDPNFDINKFLRVTWCKIDTEY